MSTETLIALLHQYQYLILFPIAVIEGPIITVIAGGFLSLGYMSFWPAYLTVIAGDTVGDMLHYAFGRYGGKRTVQKWGKYLGVRLVHIEKLEARFRLHERKTYILGKLAHGVGGAVLVVAGLVEASFQRFLFWNVLSTAIKSLALMALGYYFLHALTKISSILDLVASLTLFGGVAAFLAFFWAYGKKEKI